MSTPPTRTEDLKRSAEAVIKHGSISAAAKALKIPRGTMQHRAAAAKRAGLLDGPGAKGRSLSDFRSSHDRAFIIPQKIKKALEALGASWQYEAEFCKLAELTPVELSPFRDQYADHIVEVRQEGRRRMVWAGTKDFAAKLREMVR